MQLKAIRILQAVTARDEPVTRAQVIRDSGLSRATATRILAELVRDGYLDRPSRGLYMPGQRLAELLPPDLAAKPRESVAAGNRVVAFAPGGWQIQELFDGIRDVIEPAGLQCGVHPIGHMMNSLRDRDLAVLDEPDVAAGILFGTYPMPPAVWRRFQDRHVPLLQIGHSGHGPCDTVTWNQYDAYRRMTEMLLDRGADHVVCILEEYIYRNSHEYRMCGDGYCQAMRDRRREPRLVRLDYDDLQQREPSRPLVDIGQGRDIGRVAILLRTDATPARELILRRVAGDPVLKDAPIICAGMVDRHTELPTASDPSRLALYIHEPWHGVGRAAGGQLLSRLTHPDLPPSLTYVPAEIRTNDEVTAAPAAPQPKGDSK
jgi:hypothetical protein